MRPVPPLYRIAGWIFPLLVAGRKRWLGLEHVPETGFVLAANHTSNFDPWP